MPAVPERTSVPEILFSWTAPERPFKRRSRDFYITIVSIAALFSLVLFLIEGVMPVLLIMAVLFLFYVLSTVEPASVEYKITNFGVSIAGEIVEWSFLGRFWFTKRFGVEILVLEAPNYAGRLEIVIDPGNKAIIKREIGRFLTYEEAPPSLVDKATTWAGNRLPQE